MQRHSSMRDASRAPSWGLIEVQGIASSSSRSTSSANRRRTAGLWDDMREHHRSPWQLYRLPPQPRAGPSFRDSSGNAAGQAPPSLCCSACARPCLRRPGRERIWCPHIYLPGSMQAASDRKPLPSGLPGRRGDSVRRLGADSRARSLTSGPRASTADGVCGQHTVGVVL